MFLFLPRLAESYFLESQPYMKIFLFISNGVEKCIFTSFDTEGNLKFEKQILKNLSIFECLR